MCGVIITKASYLLIGHKFSPIYGTHPDDPLCVFKGNQFKARKMKALGGFFCCYFHVLFLGTYKEPFPSSAVNEE